MSFRRIVRTCASLLYFLEGSSVAFQCRFQLRQLLPSRDRNVDISGLNLQAVGDTPHFLGRQENGARTRELVQHHVATSGAIEKRVSDQCSGLDGWVNGERLHPASAARVHAGIIPNVRTIATEAS